MPDKSKPQRLNPTKTGGDLVTPALFRIEIGIVCDAGTLPTGLHGLTELFGYASDFAASLDQRGPQLPVRIAHLQIGSDRLVRYTYDNCPGSEHRPAVLVLPGNLQATLQCVSDEVLTTWLRQKHAEGVVIAAVCGGVFILARTGLLSGRQATTHWALHEQFSREFPDVLAETDHMVIDYGDVITAGGILAWADLGLRLVERFLGAAVMLATARYMNFDPPGREQRFYSDFDTRLKHGDSAIVRAQEWLVSQRESTISIAELARHACLEQRTFLRRFTKATGMKPVEYQQRLRVSRARELLEFTRTSVDGIAAKIGYDDPGHFRHIFRKFVGLAPSAYRQRFAADKREVTSIPTSDPSA